MTNAIGNTTLLHSNHSVIFEGRADNLPLKILPNVRLAQKCQKRTNVLAYFPESYFSIFSITILLCWSILIN